MEKIAAVILLKTNIMAEITTSNSTNKKGLVKKLVKKSTRVDLTPMVDLGFLLVTFFVFTTTMAEPKVMNLVMPNDKDSSNDQICETCALTILLGKDNTIYYYEGREENAVYKPTNYSSSGIRKLILDKKKAVISKRGADQLMLIIKASDKSSMKNLVNIIDESAINNVKRYYLAELTAVDKKFIDPK